MTNENEIIENNENIIQLEKEDSLTKLTQTKFKAFYINMDKDSTRREHCEQLLKDIKFDSIERLVPIDKNDPELVNSEKDCVCSKNKSAYKNSNRLSINRPGGKYHNIPHGIKSLTHSHKRIWEKIIELNNDDYYFIFEDDIELVNDIKRENFLNILIKDINKMPKLNNLMYLGCCLETKIYLNPNIDYNNVSPWGAHAYMINRKGVEHILNNVLCWHQCADFILRWLFKTNVFGYKYCCPYNKGHIGYLFQGRKEKWYSLGMAEKKNR